MKLLTLLLTTVTAVSAQTASCASSDPVKIQNQGDTSQLQGCTTFTGSVEIETQTAGGINFSGVRQITGDVTVVGVTNITSIGADSLQAIGGKLSLENLPNLASAAFPQLTQVGDLSFIGLPGLNQLNFDKTLRSAKTVNIQNTFLASLNGLNLSSVNAMTIANNRMLQSASFQVTTIPGSVVFQANGARFELAFPYLTAAQNITVRTAAAVSIPALVNITGNLGFYENTFTSLIAPNLTAIGQTLAINANTQLNNISMPMLKNIGGGFQVQNNTVLTGADFPSVEVIGGALDFYGSFNSVTLPALKDCHGGFNLQATGNVDCSPFDKIKGPSAVIKGVYKCNANVNNPGNIGTNPTSGTKKGSGTANFIPGYLVAAAGLVAGVMTMM